MKYAVQCASHLNLYNKQTRQNMTIFPSFPLSPTVYYTPLHVAHNQCKNQMDNNSFLKENCTQNWTILSKSWRYEETIFKRIFHMLHFVIFIKILEYRYIANFASEHRVTYLLCQQIFQESVT